MRRMPPAVSAAEKYLKKEALPAFVNNALHHFGFGVGWHAGPGNAGGGSAGRIH